MSTPLASVLSNERLGNLLWSPDFLFGIWHLTVRNARLSAQHVRVYAHVPEACARARAAKEVNASFSRSFTHGAFRLCTLSRVDAESQTISELWFRSRGTMNHQKDATEDLLLMVSDLATWKQKRYTGEQTVNAFSMFLNILQLVKHLFAPALVKQEKLRLSDIQSDVKFA